MVAVIVSEAIAGPTLGPKSLLRHLKKRGVAPSASGVAKVLRRHNLGTAKQRVIALASLTATETGQLTEAAVEGPFRFYQYASHPGQVVALDAFYVGKLKGVGAVWQLTAVDIATRVAVVQLVVGDKTAAGTALLPDHLEKALRKHGITLEGILTDGGAELVGKAFQARVAQLGLRHHRIPPRSPNHNWCVNGSTARCSASSTARTSTETESRTSSTRQIAAGLGHRLQQRPPQQRRLHGRPHPPAGQAATQTPYPTDCRLTIRSSSQRR